MVEYELVYESGMTRGQQTGLILITLVILFVPGVYIYVTRTDPTDPYPQCWPFYTDACTYAVAHDRLRYHTF